MSLSNISTAHGRREVGCKIGHSVLDRTSGSETGEEEVDEIPASPAGNLNHLEVSESLDWRERLKSVLVASGLEKETGQCWECGGIFKGGRGLKVHLARSSCGNTNSSQRCPSSSGGRGGSPLVAGGSLQSDTFTLPVESESLSSAPEVLYRHDDEFVALQDGLAKVPIRWPLMKENARWASFELTVASQLPPTGSAKHRLELLQNTIYNEAVKLFGCVKQSAGGSSGKSRREVKIAGVRDKIRRLVKRRREAPLLRGGG